MYTIAGRLHLDTVQGGEQQHAEHDDMEGQQAQEAALHFRQGGACELVHNERQPVPHHACPPIQLLRLWTHHAKLASERSTIYKG